MDCPKNLTSQEDLNGLRHACNAHNINCIEISIIPVTTELPDFEINPNPLAPTSTKCLPFSQIF
jgi:hypothetical protein